jgi:hypothetical protein
MSVGLFILSLLANSSVKTFHCQRRIVSGVVFYTAPVVPKENTLLVYPRTFSYIVSLINACRVPDQSFLALYFYFLQSLCFLCYLSYTCLRTLVFEEWCLLGCYAVWLL